MKPWVGGLWALWALAGCSGRNPAAPVTANGRPDQVLERFTMDAYQGVARSWSLTAERGDVFEKEKRVDLDAPRLRFYENDRAGSSVTAAQGRLWTDSRDFWAGGGVVLVSTDGVRLESPWMRYDAGDDLLSSTAPVVITRAGSTVRGVGWEARPDLSVVEIREQRGEVLRNDLPKRGRR